MLQNNVCVGKRNIENSETKICQPEFLLRVPSSSAHVAKKLGIISSPNKTVRIIKVCLLKFFNVNGMFV